MNIYLKKPQELYDAGLGETTLINYVRIFFHLNGLFYFSVWAYFHILFVIASCENFKNPFGNFLIIYDNI